MTVMNSNRFKYFIGFLGAFLSVVAIVHIFGPAYSYISTIGLIYPLRIKDAEDAIKYYAILLNIATTVLGLLAIVFGYFYFRNSISHEERKSNRNRRNSILYLLLDKLVEYDDFVFRIISFKFDEVSLEEIRFEIGRGFEDIDIILDEQCDFLELIDSEITAITAVESFVEKSRIIMREEFPNLTRAKVEILSDEYNPLIQSAKRVFWRKLS